MLRKLFENEYSIQNKGAKKSCERNGLTDLFVVATSIIVRKVVMIL